MFDWYITWEVTGKNVTHRKSFQKESKPQKKNAGLPLASLLNMLLVFGCAYIFPFFVCLVVCF